MEVEIILRVFTLRLSFGSSIIKKVVVKRDCVITDEHRYYQDNVPINKEAYLKLEAQDGN